MKHKETSYNVQTTGGKIAVNIFITMVVIALVASAAGKEMVSLIKDGKVEWEEIISTAAIVVLLKIVEICFTIKE